ncbi:hypothetical protein LEP1GSC008_4467 [Leptospira kirschneri serovar Bulgarica str. Nikolaevo]|uniref:Uncharacterized protein n=1 Tax=Leptospira kirschneri serovar Bulgarica str. Nikolaevo TaxID=1240687 RepID=M6FDM2_9LEPT|nr:hypothetical protein LEP1GSC008_4467 [Leptospira kirschneri serovar Bulgarica str. Nikolaevo]
MFHFLSYKSVDYFIDKNGLIEFCLLRLELILFSFVENVFLP